MTSDLHSINATQIDQQHDRPHSFTPLDVREALVKKFPGLHKYPKWVVQLTAAFLRKLLYEQELNAFMQANWDASPSQFIEAGFKSLNFTYKIYHDELRNIPVKGRAIVVANHPIGSLDGLALVHMISEIRPDVTILANDLLIHIKPLQPVFLPVDNLTKRSNRAAIVAIEKELNANKIVCFFPSGEVSRMGIKGIRDNKWNSSFIRLAEKTASSVIPVYIQGRCTRSFYWASKLVKNIGTLLLVREMFHQRNKTIHLRIGHAIAASNFLSMPLPKQEMAEQVKRFVYRIRRSRQQQNFLQTQEPVAVAEHVQVLSSYMHEWKVLGRFNDFEIYLVHTPSLHHPVLRELGRLREETFRMVGEGTGKARDIDEFDTYYEHLLLREKHSGRLAGAYRVCNCLNQRDQDKSKPLYTATLCQFLPEFEAITRQGMELGRSFIHPDYWGKKNLDLLWFGIGSYFVHNPGIKYFFGPVSLSNSYPKAAKDLIVHYFKKFHGAPKPLVQPNVEYTLSSEEERQLDALYIDSNGEAMDTKAAASILRERLKYLGMVVPTLFKQYVELTEDNGTQFHSFGVDPAFNYALDAFIVVEIDKIKRKKYERYTSAFL